MDGDFNRPRSALADLSICDCEPIHRLGHIQPHGVLMATEPGGLRISHISQNAESELGLKAATLFGTDLVDVVGSRGFAAMEHALKNSSYAPANVLQLTLPTPIRPHRHVLVHRHQGRTIIELEDRPGLEEPDCTLSQAQKVISGLCKSHTVADLCNQTALSLRQLTRLDRVLVYQFDPEGHGRVIAEDKAEGLEPYLHLHYPASDIPKQARRLYIMQRVRHIADVNYFPVPVIADSGAELDMSLCSLRGISPIHLEYMRNMGVGGGFSISLLRDGALWGLIIGHHTQPRHLTMMLRAVCDVVGQFVSSLLQRVEETESLAYRLASSGTINKLCDDIRSSADLAEGLQSQSAVLLSLLNAGGALIRCNGRTRLIGHTPPEAASCAMADALLHGRHGEVSSLDDAGKPGGIAQAHVDTAAGILAMPLAGDPQGVIAWFRPETARTVRWAGDPAKHVVSSAETPRLSPRRSFAAWTELKRGCSAPWTEGDVKSAQDLQRTIQAAFDLRTGQPVQPAPAGQISAIEKSQAIIEFALDGTIIKVNQNYCSAVGYTAAELLGRHHRMLVDPDSCDSPDYAQFWTNLRDGHDQSGDFKRRRKDGGFAWFQATYSPVLSRDGKPYKVIKLAADITVSKQAVAELADQVEAISRAQAVIEFDMDGHVLSANQNYLDLIGYGPDEILGHHHRIFLEPGSTEDTAYGQLWDALRTGEYRTAECQLVGKHGKKVWLQATYTPVLDSQGLPYKVMKVATDITTRKLAEMQVDRLQAEFTALLQSLPDAKLRLFEGVVIHTTDGVMITEAEPHDLPGPRIVYVNPAFTAMTGYSAEEVIGKTPRILQGPLTARPALDRIRAALHAWQPVLVELRNYKKDGTVFWVELSLSPICDKNGWYTHWISVQRDVTRRKEMEEQLRQAAEQLTRGAYYDVLTGLPNRRLLVDRIQQAIAMASRHGKALAVLFIDLDGFKHINDSLGHAFGDRVLVSVSSRLVGCVRDSDTVSRQGGDEFVVLLAEVSHPEDTGITARRCLQAVAEPHLIDGRELYVSASIGISVYPDDGLDAATLIKAADTAMYKVKASGRHGYQFFEESMKLDAAERQFIEESLRRAIKNDEFILHYQPKFSFGSGVMTGAEALIRWHHPERGLIAPGLFISVAEDCGLIQALGSWVLRQACAQGRKWLDAGLPPITIAANISPSELNNEGFLESVRNILDDTGFDPQCLELEMTEGVLMKNIASTNAVCKALKAMGVRLAIDDFGTGYSSLSYLTKFPIDTIKIDQSFVRHIGTESTGRAIVTAVIGMARGLNLHVVAEGVETQQELEFLAHLGCDEGQGYFFSQPLGVGSFASLLANAATT